MNNKEYAGIVLQELVHALSSIGEVQTEEFVQLIDKADEMFCTGVGKNGFQVKGLAMRLMRVGMASYVVGETCTSSIREGGVLVVRSGSGKTKSLVNHATKAKETGARVVLITTNPNSSIANMADIAIEINAPSSKSVKQEGIKSIQPMGSLSERSEGIFMDIAVVMLMERRGKDSDMMFGRYVNMK